MSFILPYILLFAILALCIQPKSNKKSTVLRLPFVLVEPKKMMKKLNYSTVLMKIILILLIFALAKPVYYQRVEQKETAPAPSILVIDLSSSMNLDFYKTTQTRLEMSKMLLADFIKHSPKKSRFALIAFANQAIFHVPITETSHFIIEEINLLKTGALGGKTALGDALLMAFSVLMQTENKTGQIILVSDGKHNSGDLSPLQVATMAQNHNINIHSIQMSNEDSILLENLSRMTKGIYINAQHTIDLQTFFSTIRLEPKTTQATLPKDLSPYFLMAAFFILLILVLKSYASIALNYYSNP